MDGLIFVESISQRNIYRSFPNHFRTYSAYFLGGGGGGWALFSDTSGTLIFLTSMKEIFPSFGCMCVNLDHDISITTLITQKF